MQQARVTIHNEAGLHARPAAVFVKAAKQFSSKITVTSKEKTADAKSLVRVLGLGITKDSEIEIIADGEDENEAINALTILVTNDFALN